MVVFLKFTLANAVMPDFPEVFIYCCIFFSPDDGLWHFSDIDGAH